MVQLIRVANGPPTRTNKCNSASRPGELILKQYLQKNLGWPPLNDEPKVQQNQEL